MELIQDPLRAEGFFFDPHAFRRSLYRLACSFFASAEFGRLGRASDTEPLSELLGEHQEDEISRLLVGIAATVRVIQDRDGGQSSVFHLPCGRLISDVSSKQSELLTLREACNKIIHAKRFNFDAKPLPPSEAQLPNPTYVLRPVLHLYGTLRRVEWKAELAIVEFIRAAAILVRG